MPFSFQFAFDTASDLESFEMDAETATKFQKSTENFGKCIMENEEIFTCIEDAVGMDANNLCIAYECYPKFCKIDCNMLNDDQINTFHNLEYNKLGCPQPMMQCENNNSNKIQSLTTMIILLITLI